MSEVEGVMPATSLAEKVAKHAKDRAWVIEKLLASGRYAVGKSTTDLIQDATAVLNFMVNGDVPRFGGIAAPSLASVDETFRAASRITNPMINRAKAVLDAELTSNVRVEVIRRALEAALTAEPTA
jgi:hypothetical protein